MFQWYCKRASAAYWRRNASKGHSLETQKPLSKNLRSCLRENAGKPSEGSSFRPLSTYPHIAGRKKSPRISEQSYRLWKAMVRTTDGWSTDACLYAAGKLLVGKIPCSNSTISGTNHLTLSMFFPKMKLNLT